MNRTIILCLFVKTCVEECNKRVKKGTLLIFGNLVQCWLELHYFSHFVSKVNNQPFLSPKVLENRFVHKHPRRPHPCFLVVVVVICKWQKGNCCSSQPLCYKKDLFTNIPDVPFHCFLVPVLVVQTCKLRKVKVFELQDRFIHKHLKKPHFIQDCFFLLSWF